MRCILCGCCALRRKIQERSGPISCLFGALVLAGIVLKITGGSFVIDSFRTKRESRIDEFNIFADAWNGGAVDNFSMASSSAWTYSLSNSCGPDSTSTALPSNSMPEDLKKESRNAATFSSYPRHTYFQDAPPSVYISSRCTLGYEFFHHNVSVGRIQIATNISHSASGLGCSGVSQESAAVAARNAGRSSPSPSRSPSRSTTRRSPSRSPSSGASSHNQAPAPPPPPTPEELFRSCVNKCNSQGGIPSGSSIWSMRCELEYLPTEVCVRVTRNSGQWTLANGTLPDRPTGPYGPGCFIPSPPNYKFSHVLLRRSAGQQGDITVPVRVRHERDPYLQFLAITDGTGYFGRKASTQMRIGIILLGVGFGILVMVCGSGFMYGNRVCSRARQKIKELRNPPELDPALDGVPVTIMPVPSTIATDGKQGLQGNAATEEEQAQSGTPIAAFLYTAPVEGDPECQEDIIDARDADSSSPPADVAPACQQHSCDPELSSPPADVAPGCYPHACDVGPSSLPAIVDPGGYEAASPEGSNRTQAPQHIFTLV